MKRALLILSFLLMLFCSAEGRKPRFSRVDYFANPIISDTIVYKVDSVGALLMGPDSLPVMDTCATQSLRWQLDTLTRYFWSLDTATLPLLDTLMREYNDSIVANLPGKREFRQWTRERNKAFRDSVREHTPRILSTFVLPDSLCYERGLKWTFDQCTNKIELEKIDTSYNYQYFDLPFYKKDADAIYLGTPGSATMYTNYFNRVDFDVAPFFTNYLPYSYTPETMPMYNVKSPYTVLSYWGNPFANTSREEQDLNLLCAQNITPELNLTFAYQRYGSNGMLINERTDNRTFSIGSNYLGKRYEMHFGYLGQTVTRAENGGVKDVSWVTDTIVDAKTIEVNLSDADSKLKRRTLFLTQSLAVPMNFLRKDKDSLAVGQGTVMYIGHSFELSKYTKLYTDNITSSSEKEFYNNEFNIYAASSHDSLAVRRLENKFFLSLQPFAPDAIVSTIHAGVGAQSLKLYSFQPTQFVTGAGSQNQFNTYVYGGVDGMLKKYFAWDAQARLNLTGYYAGDLSLQGNAKFSFYPIRDGIHLTAHIESATKTPHPFLKSVYFNHHKWDKDLVRYSESRVTALLTIPRLNFSAFAGYALLTDMPYYGADTQIYQAQSPVSVLSAYVIENIKLGPVHLDNRVLYQASSDRSALPLPTLTLNLRYYVQFPVVKNVMDMQVGANGIMYTKYYLQAYSPDLGVFYNQNEQQWGGNPYVDAFVNIQWKRACVYVKYCNALQSVTRGDYFSAMDYIRPTAVLKFGIYWPFYVE